MQPLPIDSLIPEIIASLRVSPSLVIEAPPGAGKTTRVPPAILDAGIAGDQEVWVLEPRRLAARMSARRVAQERGEKPGETVGWQVRFEEVSSPRTRLRFLTEGILSRKFLTDPLLSKAGVVILDEFHERHLQADVALSLLSRLQQTQRPDLKIIVMSATLDAAPVAAYLHNCPMIRSAGRPYEVSIEHAPHHDDRPLSEQVVSALAKLPGESADGDVLVFLPGAAEIRKAQAACAALAAKHRLLILPLHGDLAADEQDRAVRPSAQRKVILSTNVAETSVTIEGIAAVIDSGLARVASHSPWTGIPQLQVTRISKASAIQRAGRAGRTRAGRCLRLYTAQDFQMRPDYETPEIQRLDLAETLLELHASGISDASSFNWFEAPARASIEAAENLLQRLSAIDHHGNITETGRQMLRFPLHPRQARVLLEANRRNVTQQACLIAALLGERDIRQTLSFQHSPAVGESHTDSTSDFLELSDLFAQAEQSNFSQSKLNSLNLDRNAVMNVQRMRQQLECLAGKATDNKMLRRREKTEKSDKMERAVYNFADEQADGQIEEAVLISLLAGFPDRVCKRRRRSENELLLSGGGTAQLSSASYVRSAQWMIAADIEQRRDSFTGQAKSARGNTTMVRLASAIRPDWLLDSADLIESSETVWNASAQRVELTSRLLYDQLVLDESRNTQTRNAETSRMLAQQALSAGLRAFADSEEMTRLLNRLEFLSRTFPEWQLPALTEKDAINALETLCDSRLSFAELREAVKNGELVQEILSPLSNEQQQLLSRYAPERLRISASRQVRIHYERGQSPWIAARLQDFFGMTKTPFIAEGRVPLVLHLLAPNQRPVQVTSDLAGFWQRHYPQIRRELSRRYPKHAWPEDPLAK